MGKDSVTVQLDGYLRKEADEFVGEGKPYAYISNLVDDSVRRRIEKLKTLGVKK